MTANMNQHAADGLSLDHQINRLGLWSAAICIATGCLAIALPLDVPNGYDATQVERVSWLVANRNAFVAGWANQIIAMLALSGLFLAIAWRVRQKNPLSALLAAGAAVMATMAFVIPKFMKVV